MSPTAQAAHPWTSIPRSPSSDLFDVLWREAPFTHLPSDAPPEIRSYVREIQDPGRSLAVHYAARRHDFRSLVSRYGIDITDYHVFLAHIQVRFMIQLRRGCGNQRCENASCFTCRMRLAGTKPIRRYSPTSARILAAYMAGCRNPYDYLCVSLRNDDVGAPLKPTLSNRRGSMPFLALEVDSGNTVSDHACKGSEIGAKKLKVQVCPKSKDHHPNCRQSSAVTARPQRRGLGDDTNCITVGEQTSSKDHRSFAAATFETVAFKMIQWLTPNGIYNIYDALSSATSADCREHTQGLERDWESSNDRASRPQSSTSHLETMKRPVSTITSPIAKTILAPSDSVIERGRLRTKSGPSKEPKSSKVTCTSPERRRSTGSLVLTTKVGDVPEANLHKTRRPGDQRQRPRVHGGSLADTHTDESTCGAPATARDIRIPIPPRLHPFPSATSRSQNSSRTCPPDETPKVESVHEVPRTAIRNDSDVHAKFAVNSTSGLPYNLRPQTLYVFDPAVVDLVCDIYVEDQTAEPHAMLASDAKDYGPVRSTQGPWLARHTEDRSSRRLMAWKAFNDQAIFSVLSDPRALISSFMQDGKLMDSQTIWYSMVRLTRVTPDLTFHSLWLAADHLLKPPCYMHHAHQDATRHQQKMPLSLFETSCLMSICLHALVAAVPVISDTRTLYELSRLRAGGYALPATAPTMKQNPTLWAEYDGVFSNDLALRLAQRLFLAIAARHRYDNVLKLKNPAIEPPSRDGLLASLFAQLDFMNGETSTVLEFEPADRLLHETRVPTLLMDWARAVLMTTWDGRPYFSENTAFGGAMLFIRDMCMSLQNHAIVPIASVY